MASCKLLDRFASGPNGYVCQVVGSVDDHDHCNEICGYEECPHVADVDLLTDEVADQIISGVDEAVSESESILEQMYEQLWDAVNRMDCPGLYEAIIRHPLSSARDSGQRSFYNSVQYKMEKDPARKADRGLYEAYGRLDGIYDRYVQARPSGVNFDVSSTQLAEAVNIAMQGSNDLYNAFNGRSLSGDSKYIDQARANLAQIGYRITSEVNAMGEEIQDRRSAFDTAVQEFVQSAKADQGHAPESISVNWEWKD